MNNEDDAKIKQATENEETLLKWETFAAERRAKIVKELDYDDKADTASLIVRFVQAFNDRYNEDHNDPVLGPILVTAQERYQQGRRYDFSLARSIALIEGVRMLMDR